MFDRDSNDENVSKRYGTTPIVRCVSAWEVAVQLANSDESQISHQLLDEIMNSVEKGDDIIDRFKSGQFTSMLNSGSGSASGP